MLRRSLSHLRRNAIGYAALFLALGGTSYAAWFAPPNSVNSAALIDGEVGTPDLAANAVTGSKIADGSITGRNVAASTLAQGQAYATYHDSAIDVNNQVDMYGHATPRRIIDLALPAGTFLLVGKVVGDLQPLVHSECVTYTTSTSDTADADSGTRAGWSTLTMTTVAGSATPFTVHMDCTMSSAYGSGFTGYDGSFYNVKLTAVSVATNHVTAG